MRYCVGVNKRYDETLTKDNKRRQEMGHGVFFDSMRVEWCSCFLLLHIYGHAFEGTLIHWLDKLN